MNSKKIGDNAIDNAAGGNHRAPAVLCALALGLFALPAHAYIDPGTGGLLVQGLIAGFAVVAAFWRRIRDFIFRRGSRAAQDSARHDGA